MYNITFTYLTVNELRGNYLNKCIYQWIALSGVLVEEKFWFRILCVVGG